MTDKKPYKILQLSDLHLFPDPKTTLMGINTEHYWQQVFEMAINDHQDADLILLTGDLAQTPTVNCYQRLLSTLSAVSIACICLPGNHDDYDLMQCNLNQKGVSCNKQHLFNNWQLVNLNSQIIGKPGGYLAQQELDHLASCVAQHPDLNILISFHHHCTATDSAWMDQMQISNSDAIFEHFKQFPQIKAITTGHIHQALQSYKNGIQIFSAPATCFQFKPLSRDFAVETTTPGYRWFTLFDNGTLDSGVTRLAVDMHELDINLGAY